MRRLLSVLLLAAAAVSSRAADRCLGTLAMNLAGADNVVEWSSRAYKVNDNSYCYERTVKVANRIFIDWPLASFNKTVLAGESTTRACCYSGPRAEDAALEYGLNPTRIPTKVIRGEGEPKGGEAPVASAMQGVTWASFEGAAYLDARPIIIDFTYRVSTQDGIVFTEIQNLGDEVRLTGDFPTGELFLYYGFDKRIPNFRAPTSLVLVVCYINSLMYYSRCVLIAYARCTSHPTLPA
ncbi:MAG TPA: hypothetical protein VNA69_11020 [Thermoanaerobaculia bacterium]|nr:hypothetical protein [Thermoanaerobaculia bacterium]